MAYGFRSHRLAAEQTGELVFRATARTSSFYLVIAGLSLSLAAVFIGLGAHHRSFVAAAIGAIGVLVFVLNVRSHVAATKPVRLDPARRVLRDGRRSPAAGDVGSAGFAEILGLQLIAEEQNMGDSAFMSYELNAVLRDGSRLSLVNHADEHEVRRSAEKLARLLRVPIWERPAG